ncbi:uncharacterized protein LOC128729481 [Anopheles nili]|uniref:uncharacterized protein LOC128729481 n=1 Tax=Anopheles nili TaxID=185578 RepID=UPI00237BE1CF|nr:uncharacterized protein LOC128729481 [Anopheles nili]
MKAINIRLDAPFITQGCATRILRTIVELLLYHRGQIPFMYTTFRSMVRNLQLTDIDEDPFTASQLKKQRDQAKNVIHSAELVFDAIENIMQQHAVRVLMVLFGRTIYTAKEAFTIELPTVDEDHYGQYHQQSLEKIIRKIAMELTLSDEIVSGKGLMGSTNVFVLIQSAVTPSSGMDQLDGFQLPSKCAEFVIRLQMADTSENTAVKCCKLLEVYREQTDSSQEPEVRKDKETEETLNSWFLLETVVSGYQAKFVKGNNIWK